MANGAIMISKKFKLSPISGDASFRKFYRKFDPQKKLSTILLFQKKKNLKIYYFIALSTIFY